MYHEMWKKQLSPTSGLSASGCKTAHLMERSASSSHCQSIGQRQARSSIIGKVESEPGSEPGLMFQEVGNNNNAETTLEGGCTAKRVGGMLGRSLEKSHQLTRRGYCQSIHELWQRLPTGSICRLGHPRSAMNHAGFFHQAGIQFRRC